MRKPCFGHCGYIQRRAHVGLFYLYLTSLACLCRRQVETVQGISCYFYIWDSTTTATIYTSVPSSKLLKAFFIPSQLHWSLKNSLKIPELAASRCSILWTVKGNATVDCWSFPSGLRYVCYVALYVHQLYLISLVYSRQPRPACSVIWLHTASNSCCFRFYRSFVNVRPGLDFQWLHSQRLGGLTDVCVVVLSRWVVYWIQRRSFCSITILLHLGGMFLEPWIAGVEMQRNMITKRCGNSWGRW